MLARCKGSLGHFKVETDRRRDHQRVQFFIRQQFIKSCGGRDIGIHSPHVAKTLLAYIADDLQATIACLRKVADKIGSPIAAAGNAHRDDPFGRFHILSIIRADLSISATDAPPVRDHTCA